MALILFRCTAAFGLGLLLTLIVLVLENTSYLLNLQVQSIGHFFQWTTFLINFHTDAFGQLREGEGRAVDGKAASDGWIEGWTIFYVSTASTSVYNFFIVYSRVPDLAFVCCSLSLHFLTSFPYSISVECKYLFIQALF